MGAAVLAVVSFRYQAASGSSPGVVTDSPAKSGWKTIEYQGIRVDIPSGWERSEMADCEFRFEHWAPADSPGCGSDEGVAFYRSASFDPASGPGVERVEANGVSHFWAGYVEVGGWAVYASDGDQDVVAMLLNSARVTKN